MPRGKKTPPEVIYLVMTSWADTDNYSETARALNMPMTTVEKIVKDNRDKPEFVKLCEEKRNDFSKKASRIIDKGLELIDRRLSVALDKQEELERLIDEIGGLSDDEMPFKTRVATINVIKEVQIQKIKDVSTMIGTLYDKKALADGKPTGRTELIGDDRLSKLAEIAGYERKQ